MKVIRLCLALVSFVSCVGTTGAVETTRTELSGRVTIQNGSLATNATVFIYTAGPKAGTAVVCPSCYPDCGKRAKTDADGRFKIPALDPTLRFRLLVIAPGCESKFVEKVDPMKGQAEVKIIPLSPEKLQSATRIAGMIIDERGKPVAAATISPEGVTIGAVTHWGGTDRYVDPLAVTDENGRFWLFCTNDVSLVHAVVEGRGVAKRWMEMKPGGDHLIRMQTGVIVTGLIEAEGKPAGDVMIGATTTDRECGKYFNCDELATDKHGRFVLPNVPPGREFVLYAKMDSLRGRGTVRPKIFTTGKSGDELKLDKFLVQPANRIAGRIVLSDGGPVPADTKLLLGLERAWDHTETTLDVDGRFEFTDVPTESVSLNVRIKGYKFSKRNGSLDWLNGGLIGRVDGDLTDLTFLLEPGEWRFNGDEGEAPSGQSQPKDKPLRGAKL